MEKICIHDPLEINRLARSLIIDPHHIKQLRNAFYKQQKSADESLLELPADQRSRFAERVCFHVLDLHSQHDSSRDGASKLIFKTRRGFLIESVILRIATGRTVLCVSSQVGCAVRCSFCATGTMGMAHSLKASEILDQVVQANQILMAEGRSLRNVVFMGMGEPLHNESELYQVLEVMQSTHSLNLSPRHLLVSTVGIPDAMIRFAERFPRVGLALSLHSARQEIREQIIPLARHYSLATLRTVLIRLGQIQDRPVMIEYLLLKDINDGVNDIRALVEYLSGLNVHLNLIPYNPIENSSSLLGTEVTQRRWFAGQLRDAGFTVTLRYSLGADVAAACGQLVQRENKQILHLGHLNPRLSQSH